MKLAETFLLTSVVNLVFCPIIFSLAAPSTYHISAGVVWGLITGTVATCTSSPLAVLTEVFIVASLDSNRRIKSRIYLIGGYFCLHLIAALLLVFPLYESISIIDCGMCPPTSFYATLILCVLSIGIASSLILALRTQPKNITTQGSGSPRAPAA